MDGVGDRSRFSRKTRFARCEVDQIRVISPKRKPVGLLLRGDWILTGEPTEPSRSIVTMGFAASIEQESRYMSMGEGGL